jgi:hypothetical protein
VQFIFNFRERASAPLWRFLKLEILAGKLSLQPLLCLAFFAISPEMRTNTFSETWILIWKHLFSR